jgi:hypothetical protein
MQTSSREGSNVLTCIQTSSKLCLSGTWSDDEFIIEFLDRCMQRANYGIGEEAVQRFSLTAEDKASLELAEWVAGAYRRALVCFSLPMAYSLIVHAH